MQGHVTVAAEETAEDDSDSASEEGSKSGDSAEEEKWPRSACYGLFLGPSLALLVGLLLALVPPSGMEARAQRLVGATIWMAVWWMTESVPLGVTALLPLALFPILGILEAKDVAKCYSKQVAWLFFGGFQLAFAVERTGLHKRLAFCVMRAVGTRPPCLMLGVMISVAVLSMFLSNTSTTLMIMPVVEAMVQSISAGQSPEQSQGLGKAIMLGVAYSASIGGIGTIIGTPPNGVLAGQTKVFALRVTFARWLMFAAPLSLIMVALVWLYLIAVFAVPRSDFPADHPARKSLQGKLGRLSQAEVRVGIVFTLTVVAWMGRKQLVQALKWPEGRLEDSTISMAATILLFVIPAKGTDGQSRWLMDWQTLLKTPWHILFLFGGGFALAEAFKDTSLSEWIGHQLEENLNGIPIILVVFLIVMVVTFLTEVTSNTATASVLLPIIGQLARSMGVWPATLMVPATLAASCAFMLPIATAPNAIVFATKRLTMKDMAKTGLLLNFASAVLITAWMFTWGSLWFRLGPRPESSVPGTLPNATQNTTHTL